MITPITYLTSVSVAQHTGNVNGVTSASNADNSFDLAQVIFTNKFKTEADYVKDATNAKPSVNQNTILGIMGQLPTLPSLSQLKTKIT